jgi:phosphoribosylanthranilate isomerase
MAVIKICGITNVDDARSAVEAGADILGFILYRKSPRYVGPEQIRDIVAAICEASSVERRITTVGVFVNETPAQILEVLDTAGLDLAQLSGDEPPDSLQALSGRAFKAVRRAAGIEAFVPAGHWTSETAESSPVLRPDVLLDADHTSLYGGSGVRADESLAATLAQQYRLLLAGGLTPENVAGAIRKVKPWGVDVASGVEARPGRKDHDKVRAFIDAVRGALQTDDEGFITGN